jgi:hypothetical protein
MKKLAIIIVKYREEEKLRRCLESLEKSVLPTNWQKEIILIDNSQYNQGFARGVNQGLRQALEAGTEAALLLNPDTEVEPDFLMPLLANSADIIAPVIKFRRKGRGVMDFGGRINWWIGRTKHLEKPAKIDYVSGCAMLIRSPVWEKIGFLNEDYFLYFEDVDYCLRARKAGFKVAVEKEATVKHYLLEGAKKPLFQRWHLWRSNLIFINHWLPFYRRPLAYVYWWFLGLKIFIL